MSPQKDRLLLCYLRTGGGHYAPARALQEFIRLHDADRIEPILIDGLKGAGAFSRYIVEDGYRITQARARWIYEAAYAFTKPAPIAKANSILVSRALRPHLERTILEQKPRGIVILHFFLIAPLLEILRRNNLDIPAITIVTDPFTAHPLWFVQKQQQMVVFSEKVKATALRKGIADRSLHVCPFILDDRFLQTRPNEDATRRKVRLGFRSDQKMVLLLGGGDGMPRGLRIARTLLRGLPDTGVVLIAGKNNSLLRKGRDLASRPSGRNLRVFGYVDDVPDLVAAADAVLTKGGASTLMEILALGKFPIITTYIWEQEKGNVEFVVDNHRGIYEPDIRRLPALLKEIFHRGGGGISIPRAPAQNGTPVVAELIRRTLYP